MWGRGTCLGELPPYFIARAAARAGRTLAELTEVSKLQQRSVQKARRNSKPILRKTVAAPAPRVLSFSQRAQVAVYTAIQRYGFWAVLLAASIPNPLFDLAGLTCGHFDVPFATFFGATLVGKAIVKVSLQALFLVSAAAWGPALLHIVARAKMPGHFHQLVTSLEQALFAHQRALCSHEEVDVCLHCCSRYSVDGGQGPGSSGCESACGASAPKVFVNEIEQGDGSGLGIKEVWANFLAVLVLGFVLSLVKEAAEHERGLHLEESEESAGRARARLARGRALGKA